MPTSYLAQNPIPQLTSMQELQNIVSWDSTQTGMFLKFTSKIDNVSLRKMKARDPVELRMNEHFFHSVKNAYGKCYSQC